ncbi:TonB-dependent receptor plug domain-containing protein [Geofilum rubicundum]|uniref:TonB-dependent receptor n=1 Tax=Geofilum rubicundum JCM 15548 TaxID=1236989 RepID=A0A0E9LUA7_9BACT|nr:TonB-dependent receptor plug domain-containing protein [Geofilum rubicundum]GAO28854.1 TonB-dependent receptor [Geofilum rubicundum JCM 15548]
MKHIFIGLTICIVFAFNVFQLSAQVEVPETEELKTDTVQKKVEVAFRSIDEKDLLGGISFIDVEEMSKKAYSSNSYAFVENVVGGMNGNIWGMDELLVVVDGMVRDANNVLPSEIDQITILKGVSAVALYGSRAAKGVVMITLNGVK